QLDVVDRRAHRYVLERDRVADPHRRLRTALDGIPHLQAERREDVALLAVLVVDQRDPGAAVGVVLDGRDLARHTDLVPLEVDLLALAEGDDGLLPVARLADGAGADAAEAAALLASHRDRVDRLHLDVLRLVLLLERLFDLSLARGRGNLERVPAQRVEQVRALRDDRADHNLARGSGRHSSASSGSLPRGLKFSSSSSIDSLESSKYVWEKRSRMFRLRASTIFAPARFSKERLPV